QDDYAVLRIPTWGSVTSEQLRAIASSSRKEGKGYALLTMRKGLELPWVKKEKVEEVVGGLEKSGLQTGSSNAKVRAVMACAGQERCPFDLMDIERLAGEINDRYYGRSMPRKFTITLCACPNYCSHPYLNDVGIIGMAHPKINADKCIGCGQCVRLCRGDEGGALQQVEMNPPEIDYDKCIECGWCINNCPTGAMEAETRGCTIIVGGKGGSEPRLAVELVRIAREEDTLDIIERIFQYMEEHSNDDERLANVIDRKGVGHFKDYVLQAPAGLDADGGEEG
ncbi:MAG: 4Fe-4S binding protein, partial [Candidatus Hydrothermarchaeales archaeon]